MPSQERRRAADHAGILEIVRNVTGRGAGAEENEFLLPSRTNRQQEPVTEPGSAGKDRGQK